MKVSLDARLVEVLRIESEGIRLLLFALNPDNVSYAAQKENKEAS